jgi:hypothetical protein
MATLKLSRAKSAELISAVNYLFSTNGVSNADRTPAAELVFAELIAVTLPLASEGQKAEDFYRSTLLAGVRAFLDQLCEVVQINHEQCMLAVWGAYSYRQSIVVVKNLFDIRPDIGRYIGKMPQRHADIIKRYPVLSDSYWGISALIYADGGTL